MWLGGRRPRGHIWPFSCLRAYLHVQCPTVVVWFSLYMSLPVLLWRCFVSCVWLAPAVFPPVSRSLIILVYFSPSFHSVRCRDLLHFPAVCSACLISSGVVPVYLVLYFTAVSSKIKACLWVCSGILSCLLHTAIHDPDINKYTDSPSAPFHWSELARCFQKGIQTYVNRLLTTLLTPSLSVLDLSC